MKHIYLDHNATTEVSLQIKDEIIEAIFSGAYNASSVHTYGRKAHAFVEAARRNILTALGVDARSYDLVFTASGTEANNLFINSYSGDHLFVSATEHLSIIEPARQKRNVTFLEVDKNGLLKLDSLEQGLSSCGGGRKVVAVMLANNETGVIQDIKSIAEIAHKHGAILHTDAVQAFGKIAVNIRDLDVDFITVSAHKIGGMLGAAALIKKKEGKITPMLYGGGQERGFRAGTENIPAIVGFGAAASLVNDMVSSYSNLKDLRDYIEKELSTFAADVKIYARDCARIPNTSCIAMPSVTSEAQIIKFDLEGIIVSAGSACSSGKITGSHVLRAMDKDDKLTNNAIRISLGLSSTQKDVERFVKAWKGIYASLETATI